MLSTKKRYLQIALNSNLTEAHHIISTLPTSRRIIIEAGTPLIKEHGYEAIYSLKSWWNQQAEELTAEKNNQNSDNYKSVFHLLAGGLKSYSNYTNLPLPFISSQQKGGKREFSYKKEAFSPYIVADLKCMDRGKREVEIAAQYGASAATVLGHAPTETINSFIEECEKKNIDSMIDMMNVEFPMQVLQKLKKRPRVVILHRGVDEEKFNPEKRLPLNHIQQIKGTYSDVMISVAGGDKIREVQRAVFNDADIVVVWKKFYSSTQQTADLAKEFLQEIR